jgi:hypothetical protein
MRDITHKVEVGDTEYLEVEFHAGDYALVDPAGPAYDVTDRMGNVIQAGGLFKRSDGVWFFFFTPSKIGDYVVTFYGTMGFSNEVTIRRKIKVIRTRYL